MKYELAIELEAPRRPRLFARTVQRTLVLLLVALTRIAFAASEPSPEPQRTVLSVTRAAGETREFTYSMQALQRLPKKEILTTLPASLGFPGRYRWEGVSLKQLLGLDANSLSKAPPTSIRISALNAYSVEIPAQDIQQYDPILAYQRDGKPLSVRAKGPLILIYPFGEFPALQDQQYINRTVWQVHEVTVK